MELLCSRRRPQRQFRQAPLLRRGQRSEHETNPGGGTDKQKATEMENDRLDNEFERINKSIPVLWEKYGFRISYLTRDYGMDYKGFVIGLENNLCKLLFEKETDSPVESIAINIGKKHSPLAPPNFSYFAKDDWYSLTGLVYWLSDVECERGKTVDDDLQYIGEYLKLHMDKVIDLFKFPDEFDRKLDYYRAFHEENRITVEKIQEGRARLQALGQDSSLEAAIANLRGGKK